MCGIAGVVNYQSGQQVNRGLAADMLDIIRHRGPDDEGTYFCDEEALTSGIVGSRLLI